MAARRIAYADPPYLGCAKKHYSHDERCAEVDHKELVEQLMGYDCWALSSHSPGLREILPLCPPDVRVMAWCKPFASFKPNVMVAYAWEPVIVYGATGRGDRTTRDWCQVNITMKKGLVGAKPKDFCFWLFDIFGASPEDEFFDLFPGTGVVSWCWDMYVTSSHSQLELF
jgi:hypothetical protein